MKNVIKPLAKNVLIPLGLTAAASAADAGIHKNVLGSGRRHSSSASHNHPSSTLIISNNEMEDIKIIKSVEDSGLLLKGVTETVQNNVKEPKWGFLNMLLDTLGASLLRNILAGKGINRAVEGREIKRADYVCHSLNSSKNKRGRKNNYGFLIPPRPLTNFEIPKCYQNEPRFNGVYSRDNLPKIKNGAYVINLDEYSDIGTHWVTLYVMNNNVTYFDSFGVEHIPKEIKAFIDRYL